MDYPQPDPGPISTTPPVSSLMEQLRQQMATVDALLAAGRTPAPTPEENQ